MPFTNETSTKIPIGSYLVGRLKEMGVGHVFGVPGDFNMEFLDVIEETDGVKWIGGCNELNAGYAADGYARINGIAALVTTFGVGELSTINAVAGSFAEKVPVVHIVGTPSTKIQSKGFLMHHTLGKGDYKVYAKMYESVTVAQTNLTQANAKFEIDRILRECWLKSQPVYISLPFDICPKEIEADLSVPLDLMIPENPHESEHAAISQILDAIHHADRTIVLVDGGAGRHRVINELIKFIDHTKFPFFASPMGKGLVSEDHPLFGGIYIGSVSEPHIKHEVETSNLIIAVGRIKTDFNTGGLSYHLSAAKTIELHDDHVKIFYATYENVGMKRLLPKLTKSIENHLSSPLTLQPVYQPAPSASDVERKKITHGWLWPKIASKVLKKNDVIVGEVGTSMFGLMDIRFPEGAIWVSQVYYGSIGYTVGATLGAGHAIENSKEERRVLLFIGDGSLQVTVQEISTMIRSGLSPIIFVINNDGYTIERLIHGKMESEYNDIQPWQYMKLLEFFGAGNRGHSTKIQTKQELEDFIPRLNTTSGLHLIEIVMDKRDGPRALLGTIKENKKRQEGK
ncbi:hypothetical protein G9A89_022934 [Geosiphon pyriformis]|nr:hypothetical protein G9A89_022934 [Geosiphon pyriformis]